MEGEAKKNEQRPISDRISGTIRRFLLEDLREHVAFMFRCSGTYPM